MIAQQQDGAIAEEEEKTEEDQEETEEQETEEVEEEAGGELNWFLLCLLRHSHLEVERTVITDLVVAGKATEETTGLLIAMATMLVIFLLER